MPKPKRLSYLVTVPHCPGATRALIEEYIRDAVNSWGGQYEPVNGQHGDQDDDWSPLGPGSPMLERNAVKVTAKRRMLRRSKVSCFRCGKLLL